MLVLTRRIGEAIVIDGDIHVTVLSVSGGKIRLGITAPDYVSVHREEVQRQKDQFQLIEAAAATHAR
jgi:carbon storage regulator